MAPRPGSAVVGLRRGTGRPRASLAHRGVHSHSPGQIFYFDAKGLLRRHDYSVEIMGGTWSAHHVDEHKTFGGIVFPTRRRVYNYGADNRPHLNRTLVSIDFHEITVE